MSDKRNNKNEQHPVDKIFRDGLHDRPFEFDEKYWDDAQKTLSNFDTLKKGKGGNRLKFWLFGAAFVAVGICTYLALNNYNKQQNEDQIAKNNNTEIFKEDRTGEELNTKHQSTSKSSQKNENILGVDDNSQSSDNQQVKNVNSGIKEKILKKTKGLRKQKMEDKAATENNAMVKNGNSATVKPATIISSETKTNNNQQTLIDDVTIVVANNSEKTADPVATKDETPANKTEVIQEADNVIADNENQVKSNEPLDILTKTNDSIAEETKQEPSISNNTKQPSPKKSFTPKWFAEAAFGVDFVQTNLSTTNPNLNDWINYRNNNESIVNSFGLSVNGGLLINNFSIAAGVNAYNYQSEVDYAFTSYTSDTIMEYIYDTFMIVIDSFAIITIDSFEETFSGTNKISYLEFPLLVGYQYHAGNWVFALQTGPALALTNSVSVTYPNDSVSGFEEISLSYFKQSNFNWIAKPSIQYMITDQIGLGLNGLMRWNLGSVNSDATIDQRFTGYGVQLGLRIEF